MSIVVCPYYQIGESNILASSLPALDYQAWSAGTYAMDAMVTHNEQNWQVVSPSGTSEEPSASSTHWLNLGLVNRLRPFDVSSDTAAQSTSPITYSLKITDSVVNAIGFLQVEAESIEVSIIDDIDGEVYSKSYGMVDVGCDDVYSYFFDSYLYIDRLVDIDLPPYYGCTINIVINPSIESGLSSVAVLALTQQKVIGGLEWGYSVGIDDYSTVNRDPVFGTTEIIKRNYIDTNSFPVVCDTNQLYAIKQTLLKLRATPCLWVGSPDMPETIVWGIYSSLGMVAGNSVYSNYKLDLEGVL